MGETRAVTTLLWIHGIPGDLREYHGLGRPTGIHEDRDGPTSIDGQSGEGRTGGPDSRRDQALAKSQENRRE